MALFMVSPLSPASAAAPPLPNPNDACSPAANPAPEAYGSGVDGMIKQPNYPSEKLKNTAPAQLTYYDRYGTAGQFWHATDMGCSDAMSLMGNAMANTVFTLVRAIDRTTISVYQAAASESLLGWLKNTVDGVISGIGRTFNTQYWAWVVVLGAMWLAWWGLLRKRASRVAEGTIWMVAAMVALTWLVARPADFTTLGTKVSEATTIAFNAALPQSDTKGTGCIPPPAGQGTPNAGSLDATTRNANGLWVALVCKPWLMGEFGTADPNAAIVKDNADKLIWSQAVDLPETFGGRPVDLDKKADAFNEVAADVRENHPGVYSTFQGKQWQSRLAVAFGGLFAALIAGLLIMVIAIALIVVKISFLLLLVAGPVFLGIGIHPGIGRVIAVRWLELLLSMLLKQAALIGVLALLLWAYGLILGEALPWGLQILLIALVTFAAFVYRKPFQHLFAAVGYSATGSRGKSEQQLEKSITEARKSTGAVAAAAVPGAAGYRLARWGKRDLTDAGTGVGAADSATGAGADGAAADPASAVAGKGRGAGTGAAAGAGRSRAGAPPLNLPSRAGARDGLGAPATTSGGGSGGGVSGGDGNGASGGGSGGFRPTSWTGGRGSSAGDGGPGGGRGSGRGGSGGGRGSGGGGPGGGRGSGGGSGGDGNSGGRGSGGGSGGRGWFGGGSAGGGGVSGGGGAGGSGGHGGRGRDSSGGRSGGSRGGGGHSNSGGVPRPRPGRETDSRRQPPPLWGKRRRDESPPLPFWLRPVDRDDDSRG
jgi:uncharacterized membrane protein YgcG